MLELLKGIFKRVGRKDPGSIDLSKETANPKVRKALEAAQRKADVESESKEPEHSYSDDYEPNCYRDGGF